MDTLTISLLGLAVFLLLVAIGMPIAFAFALVGGIGMIIVKGFGPALTMMGSAPFVWSTNYNLLALPTFLLMGQFVFYSGVSTELYNFGYKWVGKAKGGLAIATELASTAFGACCGASIAASATMGTVAYPEMKKFKYSPRLSCGSIAAGGTLSSLIPPSAPLIVYGVLTNTSISKLFIGGIAPGIMMSALYITVILVMCWRNPSLGPAGTGSSWGDKLRSSKGVVGALFLFLVVMGGMFVGVFTPSEAGTIGAFGAFIIIIVKRQLNKNSLIAVLKGGITGTCFVLTITIGAMIFTNFLTVSGFTSMFTSWVKGLPLSPTLIMICIVILYLILGCVMDALAMMLLTLPIIFPIVASFGYDPLWYGILQCLLAEVALVTPPVGINAYVVHGVTKVPLQDVFMGIMPFFFMMVIGIILLFLFPQIVTFLPGIMS